MIKFKNKLKIQKTKKTKKTKKQMKSKKNSSKKLKYGRGNMYKFSYDEFEDNLLRHDIKLAKYINGLYDHYWKQIFERKIISRKSALHLSNYDENDIYEIFQETYNDIKNLTFQIIEKNLSENDGLEEDIDMIVYVSLIISVKLVGSHICNVKNPYSKMYDEFDKDDLSDLEFHILNNIMHWKVN
tara:strand:- start:1514 stop:2068 length:555 start_codon:yes stop_codon:yes gene_type:complete